MIIPHELGSIDIGSKSSGRMDAEKQSHRDSPQDRFPRLYRISSARRSAATYQAVTPTQTPQLTRNIISRSLSGASSSLPSTTGQVLPTAPKCTSTSRSLSCRSAVRTGGAGKEVEEEGEKRWWYDGEAGWGSDLSGSKSRSGSWGGWRTASDYVAGRCELKIRFGS